MQIDLKDTLYKKIELYCKTNSIANIEEFINKLLEKQYTIEVYGDRPGSWNKQETPLSKPKKTKTVKDKKEDTVNDKEEVPEIVNTEKLDNGVEMVIMEAPKKRIRKLN